jgi:hypothetical protein
VIGTADSLWGANTASAAFSSALGHVLLEVDYSHPALPPYYSPEAAVNDTTEATLAHEIGHNLGLRHTNLPDSGGAIDPNQTCYPYATSTIQNAGFDSADQIFVPRPVFDLMSYQNTNWVTPYTYDILVRGGLQPQADSINLQWNATEGKCVAGSASARPAGVTGAAEPVRPAAPRHGGAPPCWAWPPWPFPPSWSTTPRN